MNIKEILRKHLIWLENETGGGERFALNAALNIALARIAVLNRKILALHDTYTFEDCPRCDGVINQGWICIECGYDPDSTIEN